MQLYTLPYQCVRPSIVPLVRNIFESRAVFMCVCQEGLSVNRSFHPSICPTVCPLRVCRKRVSRLFLATGRSYIGSKDHVLRASLITRSFHLSVRPSVSPYMSHVQYTRRHSPGASAPGRDCFADQLSVCLKLGEFSLPFF